ncbi:MAG: hypothetical protein ACE366_17135 [Bradymonadia bacterium]
MKMRVLVPGLLIPGGGYMVLGAYRQGLAFLSIGLLVAALWTDLFTQFRFGLLLFWGVLSLAGILGAEQVERYDLGEGLGIAWIINGTFILVGLGLALGFVLKFTHLLSDGTQGPVNLDRARYLLLIGEMTAYSLGGIVLGIVQAQGAPRTAAWSAVLAIGWSLIKGINEVGVEQGISLLQDRWVQMLFLYLMCLISAVMSAWVASYVTARWRRQQATPHVKLIHPPPVSPSRAIQLKGPTDES